MPCTEPFVLSARAARPQFVSIPAPTLRSSLRRLRGVVRLAIVVGSALALSGVVERAPRPLLARNTNPDASSVLTTAVEERPFQGRIATGNEDLNLQPLLELFVHPRKLLLQMPCVTADESTAARIRAGRTVNLPELSRSRQVKVFAGQRDLIAIATRVAGTLFHAKIVLCS